MKQTLFYSLLIFSLTSSLADTTDIEIDGNYDDIEENHYSRYICDDSFSGRKITKSSSLSIHFDKEIKIKVFALNLTNTKIENASFKNAKITTHVSANEAEQVYVGGHNPTLKFAGLNLDRANVKNSQFDYAKFSLVTRLKGCTAGDSYACALYFNGNMKRSSFVGASFTANFPYCVDSLSGLGITAGLCLKGNISKTDFSNTKFDLHGGNDYSDNFIPNFHGVHVDNATLNNVSFKNATINMSAATEGMYTGLGFYNSELNNVDLTNIIFNAKISISLEDAGGVITVLQKRKVYFSGCTLRNVIMDFIPEFGDRSVQMDNVVFKNLNLSEGTLNSLIEKTTTKNLKSLKFENTTFEKQNLANKTVKNLRMQNSSLSGSDFSNAILENCDFRGTNLSDTEGTYSIKNTIMTDGVIKNFSMSSAEDSFSIAKHENATTQYSLYAAQNASSYNGISAKISEDDALVSGGAVLTIDDGGLLEVVNGKTLTVDNNGILEFNIGEDYEGAMLSLENDTSFVFGDGEIIINLSTSADDAEVYTFELIDAENGSFVGYDSLVKDENVKLFVDGELYTGDWYFTANASGLSINVPEPADYAAILGAIAIAFALKRRCSKK